MKYVIAVVFVLAATAAYAGQYCTTSCQPTGADSNNPNPPQYCVTTCY